MMIIKNCPTLGFFISIKENGEKLIKLKNQLQEADIQHNYIKMTI